jgi:uncharacterized protein YwlG (UPF0340 family)
MSAVCIIAPVVIAGWPIFSAAVTAAASSLGYQLASESVRNLKTANNVKQSKTIELDIERSEVVTGQIGRDQRIAVTRDGVTVTFSRNARGKASLCVSGEGRSAEALRAIGEELSRAVVQQYVYQKLLEEIRARGFVIAEQETSEDRSIHLTVRQWES